MKSKGTRIIKIVVTGSDGMVGNAIRRTKIEQFTELLDDETQKIIAIKKPLYKFVFLTRKDVDLLDTELVNNIIRTIKPDVVIHLAAKVGGLFANQSDNISYYFDNLKMSQNILTACKNNGIRYVFSFLSTCIYPRVPGLLPYKEKDLHNGEPHQSNFGYAFAKRQHEVICRLFNETGSDYICLIPNNLYGPNDNFDLNKAHVIPAIIKQTYNAINENVQLKLLGSGQAKREFTFVDDVANQTIAYMLYYMYSESKNKPKVINIGTNEEISIKDVTNKILQKFKLNNLYNNLLVEEKIFTEVEFSSNYDGIYRKPSSLDLLHTVLPKTKITTNFDVGITKAIDWFLEEKVKNR